METKLILIIVAVAIVIMLCWGLIGGFEASSIGVTCDMGVGDSLCWRWHTNPVGELAEGLNDILNG